MSTDHGQFSGVKGMTPAKHAKNIDREIDRALAAIAADERDRAAEDKATRKTAREAEVARVKLTHEDVKGARIVRTRYAWHVVVRVNSKTVTDDAGFEYRVPIAKILEVRR